MLTLVWCDHLWLLLGIEIVRREGEPRRLTAFLSREANRETVEIG
jgi:hypothetical protein